MGKLYNFLRHHIKFFGFSILLLGILLIWAGNKFLAKEPQQAQSEKPAAEESNTLSINAKQEQQVGIVTQVLPAPADNLSSSIQLQGQAVWSPSSKIMLTSPISGVIQQIFVQPLTEVGKSTHVVAIYSPDIIQIQNEILQLRSQQQLFSQNLARERQLFSEGIIAEKRVQEARYQLQQINIDLEAKQRLLKFMGVSSTSGLNPVVTVKSPASGMVEALNVTAGQHVESGAVIGQMINRDMPLMLTLRTPVENAQRIRAGDGVTVEGCNIQGEVVKISPALNGNTQTQEIMVQMRANDPCLNANQYVRAQIAVHDQVVLPVWSVPSSALTLRAGQNYVFIKRAHGFEAVAVEVISANAQTTQISGTTLKTGQIIAVTGVERLKAILSGFGADQAAENQAATVK